MGTITSSGAVHVSWCLCLSFLGRWLDGVGDVISCTMAHETHCTSPPQIKNSTFCNSLFQTTQLHAHTISNFAGIIVRISTEPQVT
jgi:hypothetical protein